MVINVPFQSTAELAKLGASKNIIDYIRKHHGYDTSRKMIIAKVLGRDAYRLYASVGNQWMDASLQDLDPELFQAAEASQLAAELGRKGGASTSKAKQKSSAANGKLGGRPKSKDKGAN